MLSLAVGLVGTAALCWPLRPAATRLRAPRPGARLLARRIPVPSRLLLLAGTAAVVGLTAGPAIAVAVTLLVWTVEGRFRARRLSRRRAQATAGIVDALTSLVGGLRAGGHPAACASAAAEECAPPAAGVMRMIAAAGRLGGDVRCTLSRGADRAPELVGVLDQLATAWDLAGRHGLGLADVLDAVRMDLAHRARFAAAVHARMAGPRSSATVLAALPAVGIVLGEAMGAHPVRVLLGPTGQWLALLGSGLICAGVRWSAWLTERPVLP
ncbi:MAG: type II secretion system F family protein [Sciscionella sp.]